MSIQRYRYDPGHGHVADANGSYVLHSEAQARISELESHLRKMTVGTKGEHRIPNMREVEEARAALENSNEPR